mgnify:CR=1 FL=1
MYDFEYNNIMDYWSNEFHVHIPTDDRKHIIRLYETALDERPYLEFNHLCKHMILHVYLVTKYPTLNIFDTIFSKVGMN